jgi:hypothetical protein
MNPDDLCAVCLSRYNRLDCDGCGRAICLNCAFATIKYRIECLECRETKRKESL